MKKKDKKGPPFLSFFLLSGAHSVAMAAERHRYEILRIDNRPYGVI